jgi:hypothetical protein
MKLAQVALSYGADDFHGTIIEEHIFHMAGATSPQLQTEADMIKAIRETGRTPVQRNTFYEPIKVFENAPAAAEPLENPAHSKVLEDNLATALFWQLQNVEYRDHFQLCIEKCKMFYQNVMF